MLVLPIKKKWFDMIKLGVKTEEYREVKDYWVNRLCIKYPKNIIAVGSQLTHKHSGQQFDLDKFDLIEFSIFIASSGLVNFFVAAFTIPSITLI